MTVFVLQSALLLAIAYAVGCIAGCLLHRQFGSQAEKPAAKPSEKAIEPVRAAAPEIQPAKAPDPKPEPKAEPNPGPAAVAGAPKPSARDDLKRIKGIGRQNEIRLNAQGVTAFAQIAAWSEKDQENWGERLAFPGRIEREEWVRQAKALAEGGAGSKTGK